MAGELNATYNGAGATLYALIRKPSDSGKIWDGSSFVAFSAGDIATYDIPLTDRGGDFYSEDLPSGISNATECRVTIYLQAGGSPATTDEPLRTYTVIAGNATQSAPSGEDLITLAQLKTYLNISVSTYDSQLSALISDASYALLKYCERDSFKSTTYTSSVFNGNGQWYFILPNTPITSITSFVFHSNSTSDTTTYSGSNFNYEANTGEVRWDPDATTTERWPFGFQNVQCTYVAGYSSIPADLQLIAKKFVAKLWRLSTTNTTVKSEKIGDYAYENFDATKLSDTSDPTFDDIRAMLASGGYYRPHVTAA